jgi:hypothetical protein
VAGNKTSGSTSFRVAVLDHEGDVISVSETGSKAGSSGAFNATLDLDPNVRYDNIGTVVAACDFEWDDD